MKNLSGILQQISSLLESCSEEKNATTAVIAAGNVTTGSGILLPTLNGYVWLHSI